jgi:hypothetical protein
MSTLGELLFGGEKEFHENGSSTERFSDGQSLTRDADGKVTEYSRPEDAGLPLLGLSMPIQVTYDGDGRVINTQHRK